MEGYVTNLTSELLDRTNKYLTEADLSSFILPLPFTDDSILNEKQLLSKLLCNCSHLSKKQLFNVLQRLSSTINLRNSTSPVSRHPKASKKLNDVDYSNYSSSYDITFTLNKNHIAERRTEQTFRSSRLSEQSKNEVDSLAEIHTGDEIGNKLIELIKNISDPGIVGFIMIISCKKANKAKTYDSNEVQYIPFAGGIVELLDPEEHCLKAIWCDPNLPSKVQSDFCKILILRLLGHAFDYCYPGTNNPQRFKHISILNVYGILFPKSVYSFIINSLKFGKHFETGYSGGSHEDSATNPCKCLKLFGSSDAHLFWGISESRLKGTYSSIKSQIPLSPSYELVKAVRLLCN
ncbi:hypothetical protein MACJ_000314 [Theileria orientalis]|uniref:Uncharacterized protein n=1 Tax=Theileria orientalis TaxID=68886 RepID=A0A976QRK9_THEOR|nr:hypothetical protein MACJ_000314 [Theileria orientalis]